jgi:hypothetical protein
MENWMVIIRMAIKNTKAPNGKRSYMDHGIAGTTMGKSLIPGCW